MKSLNMEQQHNKDSEAPTVGLPLFYFDVFRRNTASGIDHAGRSQNPSREPGPPEELSRNLSAPQKRAILTLLESISCALKPARKRLTGGNIGRQSRECNAVGPTYGNTLSTLQMHRMLKLPQSPLGPPDRTPQMWHLQSGVHQVIFYCSTTKRRKVNTISWK
jgi:hypothetical protein